MIRLTPAQRRALTLAGTQPTRVVLPGRQISRLEITYQTAATLLTADPKLLQTIPRIDTDARVAAVVVITDAGRTALHTPVPDTPRLLTYAARPRGSEHGYTDKPGRAMFDEPEAVDDATLERITLGKLMTAEQRRRNLAIEALATLDQAIKQLEPLSKGDKRYHDELRWLRKRRVAISRLINPNENERAA